MALGGLWHGAGWTFVIWGVLHGLGLGAGVLWRRAGLRMPAALGWVLTLAFVLVSWVFFRASSLDNALSMLRTMFGPVDLHHVGSGWLVMAVGALVATLGPTAWQAAWSFKPRRMAVVTAALLAFAIFKLGENRSYEFIYFQF